MNLVNDSGITTWRVNTNLEKFSFFYIICYILFINRNLLLF